MHCIKREYSQGENAIQELQNKVKELKELAKQKPKLTKQVLIAQESAERKAKMVAQDQAKSNKLNQSK
ncbi:13740_t:CDS:2 [Entrophospora sp. SA101]|nr:13740_t:CDS:2 [Entrophospora sp. SA101]